MSGCHSCNQPITDFEAQFCAYCGVAQPAAVAAGDSFTASTADEPPPAPSPPDALAPRSEQRRAAGSQADPRAVAVALAALALAVVAALALAYGPKTSAPALLLRSAATVQRSHTGANATPVSLPVGTRFIVALLRAAIRPNAQARRPRVLPQRYRASGYSIAYPNGWLVAQRDQPVSNYRQTVLASADGAAKVIVDYSPGETLAPAAKASQVEAATSRTPGYQRIAFAPITIQGHAAFAWDFRVADADARRADLFVKASSGGFALLAHGLDFARARSAARAIAGSLSDTR